MGTPVTSRSAYSFLSAGAMLAILAGSVAASGLTVTKPCGCQPVVEQWVGNAPYTPAIDNRSGEPGSDVKPYGSIVTFTP